MSRAEREQSKKVQIGFQINLNERSTYNAAEAGKSTHYQQGYDLVDCPLVEASLNNQSISCFSSDQTIDVGEGE